MVTKKGNASRKAGSSGTGGRERPEHAASSSIASDKAMKSLWTRQSDCLQKLNRICERVGRERNKLAAEHMNRLLELQQATYKVQHDAHFKFGINALDGVTTPDAQQRLWKEFEIAQEQEKQATEESNRQAIAALDVLNESANLDWEKTCGDFLESIKDDLEKMDEGTVNPDLLVAMGQNLIWISSCMRKNQILPP